MEDTIAMFAIIGVLVSAAGIFGGFVYNARSIRQNTKIRYYEIQKDIENEFHEIQALRNQDLELVHTRVFNFSISLVLLVHRNMIPKEYVFPKFTRRFSYALWIQDNTSVYIDDAGTQEEIKLLKQFCTKNNILPLAPDLKKLIKESS